jgi:hypothetical protein
MRCHRCAREIAAERVGVRDVCPGCAAYLHCCRNCDLYAPGMARDCREPNAERVADKEQGNFCDWFRLPAVRTPGAGDPDDARTRLAALFGKKPSGGGERP